MTTNTVQIKRSETSSAPATLKYGELAYTFKPDAGDGNAFETLYIGDKNDVPIAIGGGRYLNSHSIAYENAVSQLKIDGGTADVATVQQAIDEVDRQLDEIHASTGAGVVGFDATATGLTQADGTTPAATVDDAIAALDKRIDDAALDALGSSTGASSVGYDAGGSGLESSPGVPAANVQQAVDALDAEQDALGETGATAADSGASQIAYNNAQAQYPNTTEGVVVDDVQSALDSADDRLDAIELNYVTTNTDQTISGNKTFTGETVFQGTSTVVNSTDMSIQDNIIELNRGEASADGSGVSAGTAGITIDRGTTDGTTENPDARLLFDETQDRWVIDNGDGTLQTIAVGDEANYQGLDGINIGDGTTVYDAEGAALAQNAIEVDNTVVRTDRAQVLTAAATHTYQGQQFYQAGIDGLAADGTTKTALTNFEFDTSVVDAGTF